MKKTVIAGLVCGLLIMSGVANATIVPLDSDPLALTGQSGLISATQTQGSNTYSCDIAYAVYDAAVYAANGRFDPSNGQDKYIYAYQIFNSVNSDTDIKSFAVDIPQGVTVDNITFDITAGEPSGIIPHLKKTNHNVTWQFSSNTIDPGEHSAVLLFTSNFAPASGNTSLQNGNTDNIGGISVAAPSPTPEPATIVILSLGAILLRKK